MVTVSPGLGIAPVPSFKTCFVTPMMTFVREKFRYWNCAWVGILGADSRRRENIYDMWKEDRRKRAEDPTGERG